MRNKNKYYTTNAIGGKHFKDPVLDAIWISGRHYEVDDDPTITRAERKAYNRALGEIGSGWYKPTLLEMTGWYINQPSYRNYINTSIAEAIKDRVYDVRLNLKHRRMILEMRYRMLKQELHGA